MLSALQATPGVTPQRSIFRFPECFNISTLTSPSLLGPSTSHLGSQGLGAEGGSICLPRIAPLPAATKLPEPPPSWAPVLPWVLHKGCVKHHDMVPRFGPLQTPFLKALSSTGPSLELVRSLFITPGTVYCKYCLLFSATSRGN